MFFFILLIGNLDVYAQCTAPTVTQRDFCVGQVATIKLSDDNATNVAYSWYLDATMTGGSYGVAGTNGRTYMSPNTQSGSRSYFYEKEVNNIVGPAYRSPSGGQYVAYDGTNAYSQKFSNTNLIVLNSVKVIVKITDLTKTYGLAIRYTDGTTTTYSAWLEGKPSSFLDIGSGYYQVKIPVNITIPAGTGRSIELITETTTAHTAVDGMYWWSGTEYNGASYFGTSLTLTDPGKNVGTVNLTPLIMDWDVTMHCPRTEVVTQLAAVCCVPVGENVSLSKSSTAAPTTAAPVTITASGTDLVAGLYYYWYDVSGTLVSSGVDKKTYSATAPGQYTVKIVRIAADLNTFSCYTTRTIILGIQSIFAPNDFTMCLGDPVALKGEGAEGNYDWHSSDPVANSYIATHDVQETELYPVIPGTFKYTVSGDVLLGNIASDGKFEFFNPLSNYDPVTYPYSFQTGLGPAVGATAPATQGEWITGPGQFRVDNQIRAWCSTCFDCKKTTYPDYWTKTDPISGDVVSRGNIFSADPVASAAGTPFTAAFATANPLWQLSGQAVEIGKTYTFTMDISNFHAEAPPQIMLLVNGVALNVTGGTGTKSSGSDGSVYYTMPSSKVCEWETITGTWTATSSTATITVSEVANILSGHEFAMDDITFSTGRGKQTDDVNVTVNNCDVMQARADGTTCVGTPFPLSMVSNNGFFMDWRDETNNVIATTETAKAYPTTSQAYTARAKFPVKNFIKNGDFESNLGLDFTTSLIIPGGSNLNQGDYWVAPGTSSLVHAASMGAVGNDEKPGTATGKMMLMRPDANDTIISKTIPVTAGQEYGFSFWLDHLHPAGSNCIDYSLGIKVGGTIVKTITLPCGAGWTYYNYVWTAATTASVVVQLVMVTSHYESGIALDNVTLAQLGRETTDDVNVTVTNCFKLVAGPDATVCAGTPYTLTTTQNDGYVTSWKDPSGTVIATTTPAVVYPVTTGDYTVTAKFPITSEVAGGDFESGMPFTTGFILSTYSNSGDYIIGYGNETTLNSNCYSLTQKDHTTGTGKMFLGRIGATTRSVMTTTVTVKAGEQYLFSTWLKNMHPHIYNGSFTNSRDHTFTLYIGGTAVYTYVLGQNTNWNNMVYAWTAATAGSVTVELKVTGTHDESTFAMDDVKISQLGFEDTDATTLTVNVCNTLTLTNACNGQVREVYAATDGTFMGWYNSAGTLLSTNDTLTLPGITANQTVTAKIGVTTAPLNTNGNFDADATGHTLTGTLQTNNYQLYPSNYYCFTKNASTISSNGFVSLTDATGNAGKYLVYNTAANSVGATIYKSNNLTVQAGVTYSASFAIAYVCPVSVLTSVLAANTNTGKLYPVKLYINGVLAGTYDLAKNNLWQRFSYTWTQAAAGITTIELRMDKFNEYNSTQHLAWGIDDVYLKPVTEVLSKSATVAPCVPPCNTPTAINITTPAAVCAGNNVTINATYADAGIAIRNTSMKYLWYKQGSTPGTYTTISGTGTVTVPAYTLSAVAASGTYVLRVEDGSAGDASCYLENTVNVTVDPTITVDIGADKTICDYNTATFDAGSGFTTYKWSNAATTQTISPTTSGTYTVTVTKGTCSATDNTVLTINPSPTAVITNTDLEYCGTTSDVNLTATAVTSATYAWKNTGGTTVSTANPYNAAPAGTYTVDVTLNGCTKSSTAVTVKTWPVPTYSITGGGTICYGDAVPTVSMSLTGTAPWTVTYNDGSDHTVTITTSPYSFTVPTTAGTNVTYTVKSISDAHCTGTTNTTSATVVINAKPTVTFNDMTNVCQNSGTVDLLQYVTPKTGTFSGTGVTGTNFTPSTVGTFNITYTVVSNGCSTVVAKLIVVYALPTATITTSTGSTSLCSNAQITLNGVPTGGSGTWNKHTWSGSSSPLDNINLQNPLFQATVTSTTTYSLTYTVDDSHGCTGSATTTLTVYPIPVVTIDAKGPYCVTDPDVTLTATPAGGTFSGTGVTTSPTFSPSTAGDNTHTITYSVTQSGCSGTGTTSIVVNALPVITFGAMADVCSYTTPFDITTASPAGGTYSGTGITTSPQFSPSVAGNGTKTITYSFTNTTTNCSNSATQTIVVNAQPSLTFNLPTDRCVDEGLLSLGATPTGGTYSGFGVTGTQFDPTAVTAETPVNIRYMYSNGKCSDTADKSITVHYTEPPTATGNSGVLQNLATPIAEKLTADGTDLVWYSDATLSTQIGIGTTITPTERTIGLYYYYVTQEVNGCKSQAAKTTWEVTDCPSPKPVGTGLEICEGKTVTELTTTTDGKEMIWYASNGDIVTRGIGTTTYTPTVTDPGTYVFRTREYDDVLKCYGPYSDDIKLIINPLPELTLDVPAQVCIDAQPLTLASTTTGTGGTETYTIAGGLGLAWPTFNPSLVTKGNYTITYTHVDEKTCSSSTSKSITVNQTDAPTVADFTTVSYNIFPTISASGTGTINWYDALASTTSIYTGATLTHGKIATGSYPFWATQTLNNCESPKAPITLHIIDCGTAVPSVDKPLQTICIYGTAPTFNATNLDPNVKNIRWKDSTGTTVETLAAFTPTFTKAGTYRYTLTQDTGCESGPATLTLVVNKKPDATLTIKSLACIDEGVVAHTASPAGGVLKVDNAVKTSFDPQIEGQGDHTLTYEVNENGCLDTAIATITVQYTAPPTLANKTVITYQLAADPTNVNLNSITATADASATLVSWMNGSNSPLGDGNPFAHGKTTSGTYNFKATQTVKGCKSQPAQMVLTLIDCGTPAPGVDITAQAICKGDANPLYTATGLATNVKTIRWKDSVNNVAGTGTSFTPTFTDPGLYRFTVTQDTGCEGPGTNFTFTVNKLPVPSIIVPANVCVYEPSFEIPVQPTGGTLSGNGISGVNFTPATAGVGPQTITYSYTDGNNCTDKTTGIITVRPRPAVDIVADSSVCDDEAKVQLITSPAGGTITGVGYETPDLFNPKSGSGTHNIAYSYTDTYTCVNTDTIKIVVHTVTTPTISAPSKLCITDNDTVVVGLPAPGTGQTSSWSGTGMTGNTFSAKTAGNAASKVDVNVSYAFQDEFGCNDTTTVTITVNPLPVITFDTPAPVCFDAGITNIVASPAGGTFTGLGTANGSIFGSTINPEIAGEGNHDIRYDYTDPLTGCSNSETRTLTVNFTPAPTVRDTSEVYQNVPPVPPLIAKGLTNAAFTWYNQYNNGVLINQVGIGDSYANSSNTNIGLYTYYVAQTLNNCQSKPATAVLEITNCPNPKPVGSDSAVCDSLPIPQLKVSGTGVVWYNATTNAEVSRGSNTLAPVTSGPGTYTYYAKEYNATLNCYSPKSNNISLTIHPSPKLTLTVPSDVCQDASPATITMASSSTVAGGTTSYTITGGTGLVWPTLYPSLLADGTYTVTYSQVSTYGCSQDISKLINIHYTAPPVVSDVTTTSYNTNMYLVATGTNIKWYDDALSSTSIGSDSPFNHGKTTKGDYPFWATQTLNNCESKKAPVILTILDCGTPTPGVDKLTDETCFGQPNKTFTAINLDANMKTVTWRDSANNVVETTAAFTPAFTAAGTYKFTVVQDTGCESPARTVTYTIHPLPTPTITLQDNICINASPVSVVVSPTGSGGKLTGQGLSGTMFNPALVAEGPYTLTYTYTDGYQCVSSTTKAINVIETDQPTVKNVRMSVNTLQSSISATGTGTIKWYKSPTITPANLLYSGNPYVHGKTTVNVYPYYVTQFENGCESSYVPMNLTIVGCGAPRPSVDITPKIPVCDGITFETVSVTNSIDNGKSLDVHWYDSTQTLVHTGTSFSPGTSALGKYTYNVKIADTLGFDCDVLPVTWQRYKTPSPSVAAVSPVCQGQQNKRLTATNTKGTVYWVDDKNVNVNSGIYYTPTVVDAGTYTYYVTNNDVCASDPATVTIQILPIPAAPVSTDSNYTSCQQSPTETISVQSSSGITWYNAGGSSIASNQSYYQPAESELIEEQNASFNAIYNDGSCSSEATRIFYFLKKKPESPVVNLSDFCYGIDEPSLSVDTGTAVTWNFPTLGKTYTGLTIYPAIPDTGIYQYKVWDTRNDCSSDTTRRTLNSHPIPHNTIYGSDKVCENSVRKVYTVSNHNTSTSSFVWTITGNRVNYQLSTNTSDRYRVFDFQGQGFDTIYVIETNKYGCAGKDSLVVRVASRLKPDFTYDLPGAGIKVQYTNTSDSLYITEGTYKELIPASFWWNFGRKRDTLTPQSWASYQNDSVFNVQYEYGYYEVKLKSNPIGFQCVDSLIQTIFVDLQENISIPNAFCPDNSSGGLNTFIVKGYNMKSYKISVYDMWGNLLWFSNKLSNNKPAEGWDGKYNGQPLKADTYIWKMEAQFLDGTEWDGYMGSNGKRSKFGNIILLR